MPNFDRSRRVWHNHIANWGGGINNGSIFRGDSATERKATMAIGRYTPSEREKLAIDGVVRMYISGLAVADDGTVTLQTPPDPNLDYLEFAGKRYKISMKPENPRPDGTWIAFDLPCVEVQDV